MLGIHRFRAPLINAIIVTPAEAGVQFFRRAVDSHLRGNEVIQSFHRMNQGFSLVEIIVVLLLLGLVSGIAVPRLTKLVDTLQRQNQLNDIHSAIQAAPLSVYIKGENTELSEYLASIDVIPEGWSLSFSEPVMIRANGVCLGGAMRVIAGNKAIDYQIMPPLCRVEDA